MTQREDKERVKTARENLGKYFYDLSKTCFMVYGGRKCRHYYHGTETHIQQHLFDHYRNFPDMGIRIFSKLYI